MQLQRQLVAACCVYLFALVQRQFRLVLSSFFASVSSGIAFAVSGSVASAVSIGLCDLVLPFCQQSAGNLCSDLIVLVPELSASAGSLLTD